MLRNTKDNFGLVAKSFHWVVAVIILLMLPMGFYMAGLPSSPFKINIVLVHKSLGISILVLMIGRLAWRFISPRPDKLPTHKQWEDTLAKIVHAALYVFIFLMPLSGWIMSSAGGFPATFFGLFSLPVIMEKNRQVFMVSREVHELSAYMILLLLALHFAGAFKHHFIDKDDTLKRMTSKKIGLWWGIMLVLFAGFFWTKAALLAIQDNDEKAPAAAATALQSPAAEAQQTTQAPTTEKQGWTIDMANSAIEFEVSQEGQPFSGSFKNFGGKIIFDPMKLNDAYADIWIDIASIDTGSSDRDASAKSADWFDTENFPRAQFVADSFSQAGPNQYIAHGALTIRGKAALVDLPFSLEIRESPSGQAALMQGQVTLHRLDFGIGQGQWAATDTIGNDVKLNIRVLADNK